MFDIIFIISSTAMMEIGFVIAGYIISVLIRLFCEEKLRTLRHSFLVDLTGIFILSLSGLLLPVDSYFLIPLIIALIIIGLKAHMVLPMIVSNSLFNMLVPYTDPGFTFKTGIGRVVLALIAGILAGLLIKKFKTGRSSLLRESLLNKLSLKPSDKVGIAKQIINSLNIIMPYLLLGTIAHTLFSTYLFPKIMNWIFSGPIGTAIPLVFKGYDITTPIFLLAMTILGILMNLKNLSALVLLFRLKGIIGYYAYFSTLIMVLALLNFVI